MFGNEKIVCSKHLHSLAFNNSFDYQIMILAMFIFLMNYKVCFNLRFKENKKTIFEMIP